MAETPGILQTRAGRNQVVRTLRDALRARWSAGPAAYPPNPWFEVRVRQDRVAVGWAEEPPVADVQAVVGPLAAELGVAVTYERARRWRCGYFHTDTMDAWLAHEGQAHQTLEGGCPTCGEGGEYEVSETAIDQLRAGGETFASACTEGEFRQCPACGGLGVARRQADTRPAACATCADLGPWHTFDLEDPAQAKRYAETLAPAGAVFAAGVRPARRGR